MPTAADDHKNATSLASRPSFFGGFVSTRQASALPTWKPAKPAEVPVKQTGQHKQHSKAPAATTVKAAAQLKSAPPPNPAVVRKDRLKSSRNFDSDSDSEADNQRARQQQTLSKLEQKLAAAEKEAAAKRPFPKPQHAQQAQQTQQQQVYNSPYNNASKPGASKMRTVLPKGKAGAASRNMALAPQAIGLSRKQMADRGIRQAVDSVRGQSPHQIAQRPAATTASGLAGHAAKPMSSAASRPQQRPQAQAPSRPPSQPPSRPLTTATAPRSHAAQAQAQRLPVWMQKAQQAVLAGKGAKRMRPPEFDDDADDDFVVPDDDEPDWRQALKNITKYDPSKFDDRGFDDRSMEANYKQIQAEERRSARLGREDDRRAEEEELRHEEEKRRKKKAKANKGFVM